MSEGADRGFVGEPERAAAELLRLVDEHSALQDAVPVLLEALGGLLGCEASVLWLPNRRGTHLRCAGFWTSAPTATKELERRTRDARFAPGEALPGRAWRSGVPVWSDDLSGDPRLLDLPDHERPASEVAFPLTGADDLVGVVEVLCGERREAGVDLQRALVVVGIELGATLERRLTREAAEAARARLEAALAAGTMGVWDWDLGINRVRWSSTLEAMVGISAGAFGGSVEEFLGVIHPGDRDWVLELFLQALEPGGDHAIDAEYRVVRPDGTQRWLRVVGRAILDAAGVVSTMTGVAMDVTDRVRREDALRLQAAQLQLALEVGAMGAWRWDQRTGTTVWSDTLGELSSGEAAGGRFTAEEALAVLHPDDRHIYDDMRRAAEAGTDWHARYRARGPSGEVELEAWGRPLHDAAGELVGMAGITVLRSPAGEG